MNPDNQRFANVIEALRPWLSNVVVAGGWAHRLHRLHPLADVPSYPPLMTKDVDVAIGSTSLLVECTIRDRLLAAKFDEEMSGEDRPPVTYYRLGSSEQPFYVEFLTPLLGGETKRDGSPDKTTRVGGVSAQKLRHLDLLLHAPWSIAIGGSNGFPLGAPAAYRISTTSRDSNRRAGRAPLMFAEALRKRYDAEVEMILPDAEHECVPRVRS